MSEEFLTWKERRKKLTQTISLKEKIWKKVSELDIQQTLKNELHKLLLEYHEVFARNGTDAGFAKHYAVKLPLKRNDNDPPTKSRPYKIDGDLREKLEHEIDEMIRAGILELATSGWNAPLLCVRKKKITKLGL